MLDMDTQQIIATVLGGSFTDAVVKKAKQAIAPKSSIKGEMTVRIPFEIKKGSNYDTAPTVNLLSKAVIAKALINSGVTRDAFKKALLEAATEALNGNQDVATVLNEKDQRVMTMIEDVEREVIAALPRQPRSGSTKVRILTEDGQPEIIGNIHLET